MNDVPPVNSSARAPVWIWWLVGAGVLFFVLPIAAIVVISMVGTKVGGMFGTSAAVLPGAHATDNGPIAVGRLTPTDDMPIDIPTDDGPSQLLDQLEALELAFDLYARDHAGVAPNELDELLGTNKAGTSPYLGDASDLLDPSGKRYVYRREETPEGWSVVLTTLGADGRVGGEGVDADDAVLALVLERD